MTQLGNKELELDSAGKFLQPSWMFWKQKRYMVAVLAFFGFLTGYTLRLNLSIAIVDMTSKKFITLDNGTIIYRREFDWDSTIQGYVLSSFYYGYITTQFAGSLLASRIGGNRVFGYGIAGNAIFCLLVPVAAHYNVWVMVTVRALQGIFDGVTFPCIMEVWSKWAPPFERSSLATIAYSGIFIGAVISMPLSAGIIELLGWPSVFYVFGITALIWFLIWIIYVGESPAVDKFISQVERDYIQTQIGVSDPHKKVTHPWKSIFTSLPVWAIVASHFGENWGFYTLTTLLPKFMNDILGFDLGKTSFLSALPYLIMAAIIPISGKIADWLRKREHLTTTQVRKIFNCGAFLAQTSFLLGAAYWMTPTGSTLCLVFAVGLGAFAWSGFSVNPLDIAPRHAVILMGISNTVTTIPGIVSPIIAGYIVVTPTPEEWRIVFFIAAAIYLLACLFYAVFASGELQSWAIEAEEKDNKISDNKRNSVAVI